MASMAKYSILCFVHEDVLFKTTNWGGYLVDLFEANSEVGVVGIAGSSYKSRSISGWYTGVQEYDCMNITHRIKGQDDKMIYGFTDNEEEKEVVCVDGVFIVCRKAVWEGIRFNDTLLKGFHFYDIDFSVRASKQVKVYVTGKIDMIHITKGGDFGEKWVKDALLFHDYYKNNLPVSVSKSDLPYAEYLVRKTWLNWLKKFKIPFLVKVNWVYRQRLYFQPGLWYGIVRLFVYRSLRSFLGKIT